ncbi:MAG: tetratricopeptide repeat protein, partial [Clostridia bacterium]|nr:tetratricopeptide repeat protein [Clostridia bacterium]
MKKSKTAKIDLSEARLARMADKYYNEGKYLSALRLAVRQYELFGGDEEVFARFSDIYEGMGLHLSAINWWYRYLDIAMEDELPDIYEGLAVNYLNLGNETQSAYYYNKLIDADDTLPNETKLDIIDAFAKDKKEKLRFVYPPKLADYSKEIEFGSRALKMGDCPRAIQTLSVVERGSKDYPQAIEMQAVAQLLAGNSEEAERLCKELLVDYPDDIRTLATLAAVYLEQGKTEESKALALQLYRLEQTEAEDLYKVATVCCENGLHGEAYQKFCLLEKKLPYDGRMLYFKAVAAFKCGKRKEAQDTLDTLCTVYPDAEVAKYYLKSWRLAEETG